MSLHATRPLESRVIGLSISAPERNDLFRFGLRPDDVNDITVELCRRFVALGAQVVVGHQWRPGGVMEAVAKFAQAYEGEVDTPIIHNFLAHPDKAALSDHDRRIMTRVVAIHDGPDRAELPRPAALSAMRQRMAEATHGCLCLGGKLRASEGSLPGVMEEAFSTLAQGRPVYITALMGGAAELLGRFIRGEKEVFFAATTKFDKVDTQWRESPRFERQLKLFETYDPRSLSRLCGLNLADFEKLFEAQNLDTLLHLTAVGLARTR